MPSPFELLMDPISLAVFATYLGLLAIEALRPARQLPQVRRWALLGMGSFVVYFLVSSYLPLLVQPWLADFALVDASALGTVVGAAIAVFTYEGLGYAWHRAMHASRPLFVGVHQMHHSAERFDVLSSFWFHPLDMAGWTLVSTVALSVVGLSPGAITAFLLVSTWMAIFQHANIHTPKWIGYVVQRPENHSYHHARSRHRGNYASLSLWDMVFGTFYNADQFAERTGYYDGASARLGAMLAMRDVTRPATASASEDFVSAHQSGAGTRPA